MIPGYREKVFAIIGVKVYAAGLYVDRAVMSHLSTWKGQSANVIQGNSALFKSILQCNDLENLSWFLCHNAKT